MTANQALEELNNKNLNNLTKADARKFHYTLFYKKIGTITGAIAGACMVVGLAVGSVLLGVLGSGAIKLFLTSACAGFVGAITSALTCLKLSEKCEQEHEILQFETREEMVKFAKAKGYKKIKTLMQQYVNQNGYGFLDDVPTQEYEEFLKANGIEKKEQQKTVNKFKQQEKQVDDEYINKV